LRRDARHISREQVKAGLHAGMITLVGILDTESPAQPS
jgi:hypothetical protein